MAFGGDNTIGIIIDTQANTRGLDSTTNSLGELQVNAGLSGKSAALMGVAAGLAQSGVMALGAGIKSAASAAITGTGAYEQNRIAFETMLGSADKARTLMQQISDFAKSTPFELPEVVAGSKQLLAFGFAQEQIIPTMRKLGDIASGVGVPVGQLTNVFGQVRVAGRLMGQDLLQFTNAGVPLIEALATTMKKPQTEIKTLVEQGKIGFPQVEAAIDSLTGTGSKFGGMMDKQSHSFSGVVSNIKDGFGQMLRGAMGMTQAGDIVQGGLFDRLKNGAEAVMPVIQRLGTEAGPAVQTGMADMGKGIKIAVAEFKEFYAVLDKLFGPSLKALAKTITTQLLPPLKRLWDFVEPALLPTLKVLGVVIGAVIVAAIWTLINVLNVWYKIMGFLINVFVEIGQRVVWVVQTAITFFTMMYNVLSTIFTAVWNVASTVFNAIATVVTGVFNVIMGVLQVFFNIYSFIFQTLYAIAVWVWQGIYGAVIKPVIDAIVGAANWMGGVITGVWQWIYNIAAPIFHAVGGAAVAAWQWIVGVWQGAVGWFNGIFDGINSKAGQIAGAIGGTFSGAWEGVKNGFKSAINWVIDKFNSVIHGYNNTVGKIPGTPHIGDIPKLYTGARNFGGGWAVVGDVAGAGGELVNLPRGADVYNNKQSKQMLGGSQTHIYGNITLGDEAAVDRFFNRIDRNNILAQQGLTTIKQGI